MGTHNADPWRGNEAEAPDTTWSNVSRIAASTAVAIFRFALFSTTEWNGRSRTARQGGGPFERAAVGRIFAQGQPDNCETSRNGEQKKIMFLLLCPSSAQFDRAYDKTSI
jgi:hypothetical protein